MWGRKRESGILLSLGTGTVSRVEFSREQGPGLGLYSLMGNGQQAKVLQVQGAVGAYDLRYSLSIAGRVAGVSFSKEMPFRLRPRSCLSIIREEYGSENILGGRTSMYWLALKR